MKLGKYRALVGQSLRRHRGHFMVSSVGVIIGVATLMLFTGLGSGVRQTVLEDVFVIGQLEVVDPAARAGLRGGGLLGGAGLDDRRVEEILELPGAAAAFPKMKLTFPSRASGGGGLLGRDLGIEFIGDGVPPNLIEEEVKDALGFEDYGAPVECSADEDCREGLRCGDEGICEGKSCRPANEDEVCGEIAYCNRDRGQCAYPIPILVSPQVLEIYNGSVHTALRDSQGIGGRLPRLTEEMLIGFEFDIIFGESFMGRAADRRVQRERGRLVGFSDRAIQMGATMPLGYVIRLNEEFSGESAGDTYHSILVEAESNDAVAGLAQLLQEEMGLELSDRHQQAERAGLLILLLTLLFNLIALVILAVAALNITHSFSMMVMERRQEIGLMRALGAKRRDIQALVVGEATVVGLFAGAVGIGVGLGIAWGVDRLFDTQVGHFPFKPETLFAFSPWMFGLGLGVAVVFCWIGALLPALRAGRVEPSAALSGR